MVISAFHKISQFILSGKAAAYPLVQNDILVLYGLAAFFQLKTTCFVSQETLAAHLRVSKSTIIRSIKRLVSFGFISIVRKKKLNHYHLLIT